MASKEISMNLSMQDKGNTIKARTKDAKQLNKELEKAQSLATGTKTGSKASQMTEAGYNRARGAAGATGASGRDFANQAQGLGGLVRLYATYAANVFAVGAAFRALKESAAIDNMISSMNTLGAASGIALGTVAKNFKAATGDAISMQEAIRSVTKATSAGISTKELMDLAKVAKGASLALGVDMQDAVSRLTRGVTKLEPELLDELGIYAKIGPATKMYAEELGKSVTQLTDAERRQAFLNATLSEGLQKYGELADAVTNPYDRLSASIQEISQKTLSLVNTVLGPLIDSLSQSPTALIGILGMIGTTLVKQALPAIGQYRKELEEASQVSAEMAKQKAAEAEGARAAIGQQSLQKLEGVAEAKVAAVDTAIEKIQQLDKSVGKNTQTHKILQKTIQDITQADLKHLAVIEKKLRTEGNTTAADRYKEAIVSINNSIRAEEAYFKKEQEINAEIGKRLTLYQRLFTAQGRTIAAAEAAQNAAQRKSLVSGAANNAQVGGILYAYQNLSKGIKSSSLTGLSAGLTRLAGIATIATTAMTGLLSTIATIGMWIGVAVGAFTLLNSVFSKNGKESEVLKSSIEDLSESLNTATKTSEKYLYVNSPEAVKGTANAFKGIADNVKAIGDAFLEAEAKASWFDNFVDRIMSGVGADRKTIAADSIAKTVMNRLKIGSAQEIADIKTYFQNAGKISISERNTSELDTQILSKYIQDLDKSAFTNLMKTFPMLLAMHAKDLLDAANSAEAAAVALKTANRDAANLQIMRSTGTMKRYTSLASATDSSFQYSAEYGMLTGTDRAYREGENKANSLNRKYQADILELNNKIKISNAEILDIQGENTAESRQRVAILRETINQAILDKHNAKEILDINIANNDVLTKRNMELARAKDISDEYTLALDTNTLLYGYQLSSQVEANKLASSRLSAEHALGRVSDEVYAQKSIELAKQSIELEFQTKQQEQQLAYTRQYLSLLGNLQQLRASGTATPEALSMAQARIDALPVDQAAKTAALEAEKAGKLSILQLDPKLHENQLKTIELQNKMKETFVGAFEQMGDAIVDFVQTGKLEFSSLIKSMIADMIKLQLRQQMTGLGSSIFGAMFGAPTVNAQGLTSAQHAAIRQQATGGAWMDGVQKFAQGGMFTNSIVSSPTLFKFAKGTGLMGEAGPEAIMPLKRDSSGNLGVRAAGGNTEVVVNNYGSEKAQVKETQDSRGNKKVEVLIGEASAAQLTRPGSAQQRSMSETYGLKPALIRR